MTNRTDRGVEWAGMVTYRLDEELQPEGIAIRHLPDALLRPPGPKDRDGSNMACGVFTAAGDRVTEAETWTSAGRLSVDCPAPNHLPDRHRAGHWLFAGLVFNHFGHAFCYSLARFWALEQLRTQGVKLDGILFFQRTLPAGETGTYLGARLAAALQVFDPGLPVETVSEDERIEHLYVPTQGVSTQPHMFTGIPAQRAFMRKHGRAGAQAAPDLDLYISRTKTGPTKGNHILEGVIEQHMAEAGYQIYHPQGESLADQIAIYQRSRRIVGVDGSAFHVAATAIDPSAKVAILSRRAYYAGAMADQLQAFSGAAVCVIKAYTEVYSHERGVGKASQWYRTLVLTDFDRLGQELVAHGFLESPPPWKAPARARLEARLGRWGSRLGTTFVRVPDAMLVDEPGADLDLARQDCGPLISPKP